MIILKSIWFSIWMVIVPICVGSNFYRKRNGELAEWLKTYIYGFLFELSSFQIITLILTFMHKSLTADMIIWGSINLILVINGIFHLYRESVRMKRREYSWRDLPMTACIVVILVMFQTIYVSVGMHVDMDDAWYVGTAMSSYCSDTINIVSAETGDVLQRFAGDYTMAPFPIFWAMMARITGIHPAIIMHTLLPLFLIPLSYGAYYLLAQKLFKKNPKRIAMFMFFLCFVNLFGNFSTRSTSTFLMFRIWQGKSVLCNILLPIIIYLFLCAVEEKKRVYWVGVFLAVLAGTMVSSMGVFLGPVLLAILAFVDLIIDRKLENCLKACVCVVPCVLQFLVYMVVLR